MFRDKIFLNACANKSISSISGYSSVGGICTSANTAIIVDNGFLTINV